MTEHGYRRHGVGKAATERAAEEAGEEKAEEGSLARQQRSGAGLSLGTIDTWGLAPLVVGTVLCIVGSLAASGLHPPNARSNPPSTVTAKYGPGHY